MRSASSSRKDLISSASGAGGSFFVLGSTTTPQDAADGAHSDHPSPSAVVAALLQKLMDHRIFILLFPRQALTTCWMRLPAAVSHSWGRNSCSIVIPTIRMRLPNISEWRRSWPSGGFLSSHPFAYALEIARLEAEQICGHALGRMPEPTRSNIVYFEARK